MEKYHDARNRRIEAELSRLGELVSLAADDLAVLRAALAAAEDRLAGVQAGLEQMYVTLDEPFGLA